MILLRGFQSVKSLYFVFMFLAGCGPAHLMLPVKLPGTFDVKVVTEREPELVIFPGYECDQTLIINNIREAVRSDFMKNVFRWEKTPVIDVKVVIGDMSVGAVDMKISGYEYSFR